MSKQKLLSVLLAAVMFITYLPVDAFAADLTSSQPAASAGEDVSAPESTPEQAEDGSSASVPAEPDSALQDESTAPNTDVSVKALESEPEITVKETKAIETTNKPGDAVTVRYFRPTAGSEMQILVDGKYGEMIAPPSQSFALAYDDKGFIIQQFMLRGDPMLAGVTNFWDWWNNNQSKVEFVFQGWGNRPLSDKDPFGVIVVPAVNGNPNETSPFYEAASVDGQLVFTTAHQDLYAYYTVVYNTETRISFLAGDYGALSGNTEFFGGRGAAYGTFGVTAPTVTPIEGYHFVGWSPALPADGDLMTEPVYTFVAQYAEGEAVQDYTVSYKVDGEDYGAPQTVTAGDTVPVPAAPTKPGYTFSGWTLEDGSAVPAEMPANDIVIVGSFTENSVTINYVSEDTAKGTVSRASESIAAETGTALGSTATAKVGYVFSHWTNAAGERIDGETLVPTKNADGVYVADTYTAHFVADGQVVISYEPKPAAGGTTNPASETIFAQTGAPVGSTAAANPGYRFVNWTNAAGQVVSTNTYYKPSKVTGRNVAATYYANFAENDNVTITYTASVGGTVTRASESLAPATGVAQGSTAVPAPGYEFVNWTRNGVEVSTNAAYVPEKVGGLNVAAAYVANFRQSADVTITYTAAAGGTVSRASESLAPADGVALGSVATPDAGYTFVKWVDAAGATVGTGNSYVPAKAADGTYKAAAYTAVFAPRTDIPYTVEYELADGTKLLPDATFTGTMAATVIQTAPTITGYTVDEPVKSLKLAATGNVITFVYTPANDTKYLVRYYQQNLLDPENFTLVSELEKEGTTGTAPAYDEAVYEGFTLSYTYIRYYVGNNEQSTTVIRPDGSTVVELYYIRNAYSITYKVDGNTDGAVQTGVLYGADITLRAEPTKPGYTFSGWTLESGDAVPATMPAGDIVIVGTFTENDDVTIAYTADVGGSVSRTAETVAPATGSPSGSVATPNAGYTFSHWTNAAGETVSTSAAFVPDRNSDGIYTADTYTAHFTQNGNISIVYVAGNGGSVSRANESLAPATGTALGSTATAAEGYTFVNWTDADGNVASTNAAFVPSKTNGAYAAAVYTANFTANSNTPYVVNYWTENLDKTAAEYTLAESQNKTGTTDTEPTVEDKTFTGFTKTEMTVTYVPAGETAEAATTVIAGNGTTVVNVYYTRNAYSVTYKVDGNIDGAVQTGVLYGADITLRAEPTKPGYTFSGWTLEDGSAVPAAMPANDIVIVGTFTADTDIPYTVEYELANGTKLLADDTFTGTMAETVTADAKVIPGYTVDADSKSLTLAASGNVITFIYAPRTDIPYTVEYETADGTKLLPDAAKTGTMADTVTETAPTIDGYTVDAATKSLKLAVSGNVITFIYAPRTDIPYTVEYETADGTKLLADAAKTGTMADTVTETAPIIAGYTVDEATKSLTLAASGNVITFIYAPRTDIPYTVEYELANGTKLLADDTFTGTMADTVTADAKVIPGYTVDADSKSLTLAASDNVITFIYAPRTDIPYTVEYETADGTKLLADDAFTGTMADTVTADAKIIDGYTVDAYAKSITLAAEGNVITFIYTPNTDIVYTVKYETADGATVATTKTVTGQTMASTVTENAVTVPGYTADAPVKSLKLAAAGNVIVFIYTPNTDIEYTVKYETASGAALMAAKTVTGKTMGQLVAEVAEVIPGYTADQNVKTLILAATGNVIIFIYTENANVAITYTATEGGSVSRTGESLAPATGTAQGSTAAALPGYHFVNWTDADGEEVSAELAFVPGRTADGIYEAATYTANFAEDDDVTIKYTAASGGTVNNTEESVAPATGTPGGSTATPNAGYQFINWTNAAGVQVSTDLHFVPEKDAAAEVYKADTYTAHFAPESDLIYTVHYVDANGDTIHADTTGTGTMDDTVTVNALVIAGYTVRGTGSVQWTMKATDNEITFVYDANTNISYIVHYVDDSNATLRSDKLVTGKTMATTVTENAIAIPGYTVDAASKSLKLAASDNEITFVYTENAAVTITYKASVGGSVSLAYETLAPATGDAQGSTAAAADGYTFVNWTNADGEEVSNTVTFVPGRNADGIYEEATYTANFTPNTNIEYTVHYVDNTGNVIAPDKVVKNQTMAASVTEQAIAIPGYTLDDAESKTFTLAADGNVIFFRYRENADITITYTAAEGGTVTPESETIAPVTGEAMGSTAAALPGYHFVNWTNADGEEVSNVFTFVPGRNADKIYEEATYTANFAPDTDIEYVVRYVDGNGTEIADSKSVTGQTMASTVTEDAIEIPGYTLNDQATKSLTLAAADNEIVFVYRESDPVTITYTATAGGTVSLDSESVAPVSGTPMGSTAKANAGYHFVCWKNEAGDVVSKDKTFVPQKNAKNVYEEATYTAYFARNAVPPTDGGISSPKTDDSFPMEGLMALCLSALLGCAGLAVLKRRKEQAK